MPVSITKTGAGWYVTAPDGMGYAGRSFAKAKDAQAIYAEWVRIERGVCPGCGDSTSDLPAHKARGCGVEF